MQEEHVEITHPILPARASAAICVDGVRVDEAVPIEFRSIFRFKHFNKMQSACLPAVSSGIFLSKGWRVGGAVKEESQSICFRERHR